MDPIKLKINNFYSIADGEIDFSKFSSALILGYYENNSLMSNGAGKSSIFEAICWVLFNETRQTKVDDVIRWTTNETSVEFEFMFDRRTYKILRRRSRVAKESSVSFFTKEGTKWINDSGSTNSETNRKILQLLKLDAKIFLNSVYFKQHDISLFANSSPSDRKEIIKSIMKLEKWDEYQKQAKSKLKIVKDDIDKQLRIVHDNPNLSIELVNAEKSINIINKELKKLINEQRSLQSALNSYYELKKENNLNNLINELANNTNKIDELKIRGKKFQRSQEELRIKIDSSTEIASQHIQHITSIENNIFILNEKINSLKQENYNYDELEDGLLLLRVEASRLNADLTELNDTSSMVNLGQCQICLTDINTDNLSHIHENRDKKVRLTTEQFHLINDQLVLSEAEYKQRKTCKETLDMLQADLNNDNNILDKIKTKKQILDNEILTYNNENSLVEASLITLIEQIKSYKIDADVIERKIAEQKINNIDIQIKNTEETSAIVRENINAKNVELGILLKENEFITSKLLLVNSAADTLVKLGQVKSSYEQLVRSFGKEGIQAVFIESIVDELEYYANETLSHICNEPTVIKLRTQKKTGDSWQETLEIDVMMSGFPQTFESLGGGERFRISLALRIGLSEVLVKRAGGEIKMLLLDEVDSPLDAYGLNKMMTNIINGLTKRFKILVISHNNSIKDGFANIINVTKSNSGSTISQA